MNTYGFTFTLKENATSTERVAEAIYAICDDVSVGSCEGIVHAAFDRDADSLDSAIKSAASDVAKAGFAVSHVDIDDETLEKIAC
ncbi:MAG: hypothetical protein WD049_02490 [Candidatus Paceibacterota bacterium]